MKMILCCHTECDRMNAHGFSKTLPAEKQTFSHIPALVDRTEELGIPLTFSMMVGPCVGTRLLDYFSMNEVVLPTNAEASLHYHFEAFDKNKQAWMAPQSKAVSSSEISGYVAGFRRVFGRRPTSVVFGHYHWDAAILRTFHENGFEVDGSLAAYKTGRKYVVTPPFSAGGMLSVPLTCDGRYPLNPFTTGIHRFLLEKIISLYSKEDLLLHLGFHSYDFFDFAHGGPRTTEALDYLGTIKKLAAEHEVEFITLSQAKAFPAGGREIARVDVPLRLRFKHYATEFLRRLDGQAR